MQLKSLGGLIGATTSVVIYGYYQNNIAQTEQGNKEVWTYYSNRTLLIEFEYDEIILKELLLPNVQGTVA